MSSLNWQEGLDSESAAYLFASCEDQTCRSLAGPGTGKTFSLMRKIAYLLDEKKVDPRKVLIITFTRAGAADIKKELMKLDVDGVEKIHASTLHSFCMGILMQRDVLQMLDRFPRPLLDHEINALLSDVNVDERFGKKKEREKMLTDYESAWARLQIDEPGFVQSDDDTEFQNRIKRWMTIHKAMTIGEIVPFTLQFIRANPAHPSYQRFDYVLVDEYQDLNKAEQIIIDKIAENANLTIVGDDNQSIYGFKNARPEGIREFSAVHNPCEDIPMQECRRCPKQVVLVANDLIRNDSKYKNGDFTGSILLPFEKNEDGELDVIQWSSYEVEVEGIARVVKVLLDQNEKLLSPEDVLVLNPSKKIARMIDDKLRELGIPSQMVSKSIDLILNCDNAKWVYAFLTFLANMEDFVAFRYLLQKKGDFYSKKYMEILKVADQQKMTPIQAFQAIIAEAIKIPGITKNTAIVKRYTELMCLVNEWQEIENIENYIEKVSVMCGDDAQALNDRINVLIPSFENQEFDEDLSAQISKYLVKNIIDIISFAEDTIEEGKVRVMTCHSAKGLSGKLVIVSSCVDGLIPRISDEQNIHDIDEQRRLFYVALTRCKYTPGGFPGRLILSSFVEIQRGQKLGLGINVKTRGVNTSRFLMEINQNVLPEAQNGQDFLAHLMK